MSEQSFSDLDTSNSMVNLIRKIVKQELKKELKRAMRNTYPASVISVSGNNANIKFTDSNAVISNVKNETGKSLIPNDEVYVEAINGSLNNIVIKYKK